MEKNQVLTFVAEKGTEPYIKMLPDFFAGNTVLYQTEPADPLKIFSSHWSIEETATEVPLYEILKMLQTKETCKAFREKFTQKYHQNTAILCKSTTMDTTKNVGCHLMLEVNWKTGEVDVDVIPMECLTEGKEPQHDFYRRNCIILYHKKSNSFN